MPNNVLVFVEQNEKKIAEVSLELISKARELADQLTVEVDAVILGHEMEDKPTVLAHYGCNNVYYINDKRVAHFSSVPYAKAVVEIINKYKPQIVLYGATIIGRDLAPRIASKLKCGLTADCTELAIGDYSFKDQTWENTLLQIRPAFGGNIVATIVSPESSPSMATVREGVMKLADPDTSKTANIINEKITFTDEDFLTEIIEVVREARKVNLKGAKIIVAAGMGAANETAIKLLQELAKLLGGEVGCSRTICDAGFLGTEYQIGQTGTTVRPNLYIACGISGQIQHTAGMSESKRIIAINTDHNAPIFQIAHYGIVGDLTAVLQKMINAYKAKA